MNEIPEADAADFFFTFDQNLDVDGEFAAHLVQGLQRLQVDMYLSFVVSSSAGIDVSVADRGFESRGGPEVKRLRRLNIIMAVEKDGWLARGVERLGIDQGMQGGGNDFNRLKSG